MGVIDMIPKTIIIDIDGCIFEHRGRGACNQWIGGNKMLKGTQRFFDKAEKEGCCIILMTARKESCRKTLEHELRHAGLFWDALIMGVPHGERILINDKKSDGSCSAFAIELKRNGGLNNATKTVF